MINFREDLISKFISDKDVEAKLDTKSSSLRNAEVKDSSVDDKFKHPYQLKDCLINYGVANGYQLWYRRNDYRNISILCGKNVKKGWCASQKGKQKSPKIPKSRKSTSKKSQSPKTPKSPNATPNAEWSLIDHYAKLWDYRDQILATNPSSSIQLDVDTMDDGRTQFKRMYICYKAMKDGWRGSCRRVIGLDGCFLKATCRGELLTAMGRDANNQMFPMAWAVGLIEAVIELLPHVEHRLCARHIYVNLKKKWNGLHYKSLFWGAKSSTLQVQFKHKMELLKNIDPLALDWLMERDPKTWCTTYFQMDRSCAAFENGISESYHS
ncbi:hypothetical protein Tco_0299781 [Tanacetum coccineum]